MVVVSTSAAARWFAFGSLSVLSSPPFFIFGFVAFETASYYGFGNVPGSSLRVGWLGFKGSKARF